MTTNATIKLNNWSVVYRGGGQCLHGFAENHPRFRPGARVTTSYIASLDFDTRSVTTASGSVYELGDVDHDYEAEYPEAYQRFWSQVFTPVEPA